MIDGFPPIHTLITSHPIPAQCGNATVWKPGFSFIYPIFPLRGAPSNKHLLKTASHREECSIF